MMSFFKKDDKDRKKKTSENDVSSSSDQTLNPDESTLNPVLSSSSKSSIDSSIQPQIVLPPKPKKGILKTMSKFGHVNLTPKLYQKIDLIKNVAPPVQTPEEPKSIEASIPNFSKRNSVFLNENVINSAQILPDLKNIPIYIIPENVSNDSVLEPYLHRKVYVSVRSIPQIKINTKHLENGQTESEDSRNIPIIVDNLDLEFLPGDQLMFINEENILGRSLNEVKNILNDLCQFNKEHLIKFTVRTRLDYSDFILKNFYLNLSQHSEKLRKKLSNDQISPQPIDPLEINQVWYVQPNGYLSAKIFAKVIHKNSNTSLESLSGNNVTEVINFKIKLDNGKIIEVSEDCLEKSNPIQFDYCSDLTKLRFINETSLIHCIRQRFVSLNLNYTLIGNQNLLAIGANEDKNMIRMIRNLKQLDLPPHVYSQTQLVYKNMLSNRQDQSIVLMGHSNSAKSVNTKLIMSYLFKIAGSSSASNFNGKLTKKIIYFRS
ncbi:unnamed protein product [Brachionus calyciflorus]|uniref:Myosin motor domain-containing protein n=1 Tax=Brachionus calyciflorus TaxID=104777 RepID=A0A814EKE7_9BILA|nr:unnamed protein product [Brachionus calyciflorus]